MVDHHVDRPEVEAGQPAQLTGTNRSIALERPHPAARIILPDAWHRPGIRKQYKQAANPSPTAEQHSAAAEQRSAGTRMQLASIKDRGIPQGAGAHQFRSPIPALLIPEPGLVAIARGKTPDPIPNSAVKTLSADGTASQGAEE